MAKLFVSVFFTAVLCTMVHISPSRGETMELKSPAFRDGDKIPSPLNWSQAPEGAKSFAISIVDPHPVARNWVHWLVINIPAQTTSLSEGASGKKMPAGAVELNNSFGSIGYGGPQPPKGTGDHPYVITLYALSVEKLDLGVDTNLAAFQKALEGKVLASAKITGMYGR
jgi:Raf kinase inhibitor-like YbhB/YbcL family protein